LEPAVLPRDQRDVHLDTDARRERVADEELRDRAVHPLVGLVGNLLAVDADRPEQRVLLGYAEKQSGLVLLQQRAGVDRAQVARARRQWAGQNGRKREQRLRESALPMVWEMHGVNRADVTHA